MGSTRRKTREQIKRLRALMEAKAIHDEYGASDSQVPNDTKDEQNVVSAGKTEDQDGKSYMCSKCGSRQTAHKCLKRTKDKGKEIPMKTASPLSPHGPLPLPEVLEKAETSESLETQDEVFSPEGNVEAIGKAPKNTTDLLATGILEGFPVKYISKKEVKLTGTIKGSCILCDCKDCKGTQPRGQPVSLATFERHARGASNKAKLHISINGMTLQKLLEACWKAEKDDSNVLEALSKAIGTNPNKIAKTSRQSMPHKEGDEEEISGDKQIMPPLPVDHPASQTTAATPNLASASSSQIAHSTAAAADLPSSSSNLTDSYIPSITSKEKDRDRDKDGKHEEKNEGTDQAVENTDLLVAHTAVSAELEPSRPFPETELHPLLYWELPDGSLSGLEGILPR
ncbi:unnamed protein product [Calypogeia fissa]